MEEWSIKIRFYPETHEVLLHPFFYTILIKECTSARRGIAKEPLIERVYRKIYPVAKTPGLGVGFTRRAAELLIESAVKWGFLHRDHHWNARGHVINNVAHNLTSIGITDSIAYLKYYLDEDGAAIIHLLYKMKEKGNIISRSQFLNNKGLEETIRSLAEEYLDQALEPKQKLYLRKFIDRTKKGYTSHTREHRFNPRVESLVDLGILERQKDHEVSYYSASRGTVSLMDLFLELFPNAVSLETILSKRGDYFRRAAKLYNLGEKMLNLTDDFSLVQEQIVDAYNKVKDETFRFATIDSITDIVCINLLVNFNIICEKKNVKDIIKIMRSKAEGHIRYHVDDWGRIKYLIISPEYVEEIKD
mgnify:CR=1 FL=1